MVEAAAVAVEAPQEKVKRKELTKTEEGRNIKSDHYKMPFLVQWSEGGEGGGRVGGQESTSTQCSGTNR